VQTAEKQSCFFFRRGGGVGGERMRLVVGEVEVISDPPVEMENNNQIFTKVRNKNWERIETEKLLG
jgi:hypothetical protein